MVKIIWEVWPLKELQGILSIDKIEDFEKIKDWLNSEEKNIEKESKEECIIEFNNMKNELIKEENELEKELKNNQSLIRKIIWFLNIYNKKRKVWNKKDLIKKIKNNFEWFVKIKILDKKIFLESKRNQINMLDNTYYWAVWEEKVVNIFKQIYGSWILINDFYKKFDKPICTKWCKDRIKSMQIDHIYINESWIFLIETKNWSWNTDKTEYFSPIKQAERHNHAFYIFFKNNFSYINMPKIYNVVIFTWKYKIQSNNYFINTIRLNELKDYIQYKKKNITKEKYREIANKLIETNEN